MNQLKSIIILLSLLIIVGIFVYFNAHRQSWIKRANQIMANKYEGVFTATDKSGLPIVLEWKIMNGWAPELIATMKSLSDFMVKTWIPIEVDYLKAHPEEVMHNEYLKAFQPFFAHGVEHVDWQKVSDLMGQFIKGAVESDPKGFFGEHDLSIFVIAKDQVSGNQLGFIQYVIKQEYPYGSVNLGNLAVDASARNRGLGKLLTSSIFTLLSQTRFIFLYTRPTNTVAQNAYCAYGFKVDEKPIADPIFAKGWIRMEYMADKSDILQKESKKIKDQSLMVKSGNIGLDKDKPMAKKKITAPEDRVTHKRLNHELPAAIAERGWRYHHLGVPYTEPRPGEKHYEHLKVYVSGFDTSPYGIEWMRFEKDCPVPDIVRNIPHIAFEVDDLDQALRGKEILLEPGTPSGGVRTAMIVHDGAPIELIEFSKADKE